VASLADDVTIGPAGVPVSASLCASRGTRNGGPGTWSTGRP